MLCLLNNNQWFTAFICLFRKEKKQNTVCWDCMAFIFQKVHFSSKPLRFYTVTVNIYRSGQKKPIYYLYIILLRVVWETRTNTSSDQGKVGYTLATRPVHPKATIQSSVLKKNTLLQGLRSFQFSLPLGWLLLLSGGKKLLPCRETLDLYSDPTMPKYSNTLYTHKQISVFGKKTKTKQWMLLVFTDGMMIRVKTRSRI